MNKLSENKNYLKYEINPLLKSLMMDLMKKQPEDLVNYMIDWFNKEGKEIEEKNKEKISMLPEGINSDSEEDEYIEELPKKKIFKSKAQRHSVSAEVYGKFNKKEDIEIKEIEKNKEQIERINLRMSQDFIFSNLDKKDKEIIVKAMEEKIVKKDDVIIKQGEKRGNHLFIVDKGTLDCFIEKNDEKKFIKTYKPGESFGELALLYNAPRAATIIAKEECILFSLDRIAFNLIIKESSFKKREYFDNFLKNFEFLDTLDTYERSKLSDCINIKEYENGDVIINEGDIGNEFYLIMKGECIAVKNNNLTNGKDIAYEFKENDYFGELALINDEKRKASVIAKSHIKLASIDRMAFRRLLGPIENILKRNSSRYEKYIKKNY